MKKLLLYGSLALCVSGFSQTNGRGIRPATMNPMLSMQNGDQAAARLAGGNNQTQAVACTDTVRYPLLKQQILFPASQFSIFNVYQAFSESISQTFQHTGASITIKGVEFFGNNDNVNGTASVTVQASVYNVNASNIPTTLLGSGTVSFTSATPGYHFVNFATPVTVTGNYALVLQATNAGGILEFYGTDLTPGQSIDEGLSKYKSNYYPNSGGAYVSIPVLTNDATNFPGNGSTVPPGPYDIEPIIAPIVSYNINTAFTATPNPVCAGNAVTIANTTTPTGILQDRMYNFGYFMHYFGQFPQDSLYTWNMGDGSPQIWDANTSYTYSTAGTYTATMVTLGGLWNSCPDVVTSTITVGSSNASFSFPGGNSYCATASNPVPTAVAPGGTYSGSAGLVLTSTSTGQINLSTTPANTYTLTYTTAGGCASSIQVVTINSVPSAAFSFSGGNTFCLSGTNPVPSATTGGGMYSGSMGLVLANPTTGEVDLTSTSAGTYTLTYNTNNANCPTSSNQVVTITAAPDASFTYANPAYCTGGTDPSPVLGAGASAGTFSSTTGLNLNSGNGMIDLSASTAGTYTVTNNIAASGACPSASSSYTVTINADPTVTFAALSAACSNDADITLSGATPTGGTYSGTGVSGGMFDPSAGSQTITYTYTDGNNCTGSATSNITVNTSPTVTYTTLQPAACVNDADITLTGATPAGGAYSGTAVTAGVFSPATAGAGTYTITYTYSDANNCGGSATASILVDPCVGLKNVNALGNLQLYPNPASTELSFNLSEHSDKTEITIYSVEGKVVYQNKFDDNKGTVNVSSFARSMYFVHVKANNSVSVVKLVLN